MTTRHTPRESFWRGHWAALDGSTIATPNDDADAYARGAERGAAALAEATRCKTCRERWAWISRYMASAWEAGFDDSAHRTGTATRLAAAEESDR